MKVEYVNENNKEKCSLYSENKTFLMSVEQKEVKLSIEKKKYVKFRIKLTIRDYSLVFPFEANVIEGFAVV